MTVFSSIMLNISDNGTAFNTTKLSQFSLRICSDNQNNHHERIIKMIAYLLILFVSLIGNILIAAVILSNKNMKKPTNYFILNMAISDLVFPTMVHSRQLVQLFINSRHDFEWLIEGTIGTVFCKVVVFFQDVTTAVSISSLILITVDRFIVVVYPMKHYIMSKRVCKGLIYGTWLMGVGIHAVYCYTIEVRIVDGVNLCLDNGHITPGKAFPQIYYLTLIFILTVLPFTVMCVASYTIIVVSLKRQSSTLGDSFSDRQKRQRAKREQKIIRMAIAIIITFVILWMPYSVFALLKHFVYNDVMPKPCFLITFHFIALFCAYSNAAVNPCIVFRFNQNFRHGFMQMLAKTGIVQNQRITQQPENQHEMQNMAYENDN